jgi:hypothetical protein
MPCNVEVFQHGSGLKPKRNLVFLWIGKETQGKKKNTLGRASRQAMMGRQDVLLEIYLAPK